MILKYQFSLLLKYTYIKQYSDIMFAKFIKKDKYGIGCMGPSSQQ